MPIYSYTCPKCSKTGEIFRPIKDRNKCPRCPECGSWTERDLQAEHGRPRNASCGEIVSVNGGVGATQVQRARKMFAHIGVTFDDNGTVRAPEGRRQYLRYLKERAIHNNDEVCGGVNYHPW